MADLTASGLAPAVNWDVSTALQADWKAQANTSTLRLYRRPTSTSAYVERFEWTSSGAVSQGDLTLEDSSGSTLDFSDGSNNGFQLVYDTASGLILKENSGGTLTSLATFTDSGSTFHEEVTLDAAKLTFDYTTGSDFSIHSDGTKLQFDVGASSMLELTSSGHTSTEDITISNAAPTLVFDDTDGGHSDFKLRADYGEFQVASGDATPKAYLNVDGSTSSFSVHKVTPSASLEELKVEPCDSNSDCHVQVGVDDNTRGKVSILRDESNDAERMGVLVLQDKNGGDWYLHVDTSGNLWIKSTDPVSTPSGQKVGNQT